MRFVLRAFASVLALVLVAGMLQAAPAKEPTEYTQLLDAAKACVQSGAWGPFKDDLKKRTSDRFAQTKAPVSTETLRDLFYFHNVANTFSKAAGDEFKDILAFLLDHREMCGRYLHALDAQDNLPQSLRVLKQLRDEDPALFLRNSELCIAYSVVHDNFKPLRYWKIPPMESDIMINTYRYFNRNERLMRLPPSALPWELSIYVVDVSVTADERAYALQTYQSQQDIGKLFFKVAWNMKLSPAHGTGLDVPYTLQNILAQGGVCMEQAHFASEIGKCLGVPSVYCSGQGKRGGHAWVATLRLDKRPVMWDLDSGRYAFDHYYKGLTFDPTNQGYTTQTPLSTVQMSAAILTAGSTAKIEDARYCCDAAGWVAANLPGEGPSGKVAYELLQRSLGICPYNQGTWLTLADLADKGSITEDQTAQSVDLLFKYTLADFPDFTEMCLERFIASVKDDKRKAAILARSFGMFHARPDLASDMKVAEGDLLLSQGKVKEAVVAYCWPLAEFPAESHATGAVEERIDKLADHVKDKKELADTYKSLINSIVKNSANTSEGLTTIFGTLSGKLVALYREQGRDKDAESLAKFADQWLASRPKVVH